MPQHSRSYSLSGAANLLQVKRDDLLNLEYQLPELQTCLLRPSAERYTSTDFALLQTMVRRMHIQQLSIEGTIRQHLAEQQDGSKTKKQKKSKKAQHREGDDSDAAQATTLAPTDTDSKKATADDNLSASKNTNKDNKLTQPNRKKATKIVRVAKSETEDTKEGFDAPADWYYNKLYSESQGQKSFSFDNPSQLYGDDMPTHNTSINQESLAQFAAEAKERHQLPQLEKEAEQETAKPVSEPQQELMKEAARLSQEQQREKEQAEQEQEQEMLATQQNDSNRQRQEELNNQGQETTQQTTEQTTEKWTAIDLNAMGDKTLLEKLSGLEEMLAAKTSRLTDLDDLDDSDTKSS